MKGYCLNLSPHSDREIRESVSVLPLSMVSLRLTPVEKLDRVISRIEKREKITRYDVQVLYSLPVGFFSSFHVYSHCLRESVYMVPSVRRSFMTLIGSLSERKGL